jgi:hypothetical protein
LFCACFVEALKVNNGVKELYLVSVFVLFLFGFVLRVFCCCEQSGRLTCAVQGYNDIGAKGGKALGEALKVNTSVKELYLVSVFLLFLLVFVLRVFCCCEESGRLTCAVQSYNDIGDEGGKALGEALKVNTSVKELYLVSVFVLFLFVFGLRVFCCCEESGRLTCAVQWNNGIGAEGANVFGEALKVNASVQKLNLVSVFVLFLLVFVLRVFCCCEESGRLTCAVQGNNDIGDEGGKALGEALKVNTSVQLLDLVSVFVLFVLVFVLRVFCCCEESGRLTCAVQGGNGIGDEGGKALGEALKVNTSVKELSIVSVFVLLLLLVFVLRVFCCCEQSGRLTCAMQRYNHIGDEGGKALGKALQLNTSVQILDLVSVFVLFLFVFVLRVVCCCEESGRLTCAVQSYNRIGDEGGKVLGEALKVNTSVKELYLVSVFVLFLLVFVLRVFCCCEESGRLTCAVQRDNGIGDSGVSSLASCIKDNSTLTVLDLVSSVLSLALLLYSFWVLVYGQYGPRGVWGGAQCACCGVIFAEGDVLTLVAAELS